jgi:hypothetical protein
VAQEPCLTGDEAGARSLEAGWPLHHVKDMLGHADVKTTDTYLNVTRLGLRDSMRQLDEARSRCKPVADDPPTEQRSLCDELATEAAKGLVH